MTCTTSRGISALFLLGLFLARCSALFGAECGSICTVFSSFCPADSGAKLVSGESISNSLDSVDDRKVFTFVGEAGDVVGLYLSYNIASSEEPVIDLCPPSGSAPIVSENRAPVDVELPESGTYDLVVRAPVVLGANDYPTSYNVGMEWISPAEKASDSEEITFGEEVRCCVADCSP